MPNLVYGLIAVLAGHLVSLAALGLYATALRSEASQVERVFWDEKNFLKRWLQASILFKIYVPLELLAADKKNILKFVVGGSYSLLLVVPGILPAEQMPRLLSLTLIFSLGVMVEYLQLLIALEVLCRFPRVEFSFSAGLIFY